MSTYRLVGRHRGNSTYLLCSKRMCQKGMVLRHRSSNICSYARLSRILKQSSYLPSILQDLHRLCSRNMMILYISLRHYILKSMPLFHLLLTHMCLSHMLFSDSRSLIARILSYIHPWRPRSTGTGHSLYSFPWNRNPLWLR
jgi:hypothetical protein